jgi:hypothetical protein
MTTNGGTATTNVTMVAGQGQKENNKNVANTKEYYGGSKKFTGANDSLKGKIFIMRCSTPVCRYIKSHCRLCWSTVHTWWRCEIHDREPNRFYICQTS